MSTDHSNPETKLALVDFCDRRVFAVPHSYSDRNSARHCGPDDLDVHQLHDGPSYIAVGANVTDERLLRNLRMLNDRYGVTLDQLQEARAGHLVYVR